MDRRENVDPVQLAAEVLHELRQPLLGIKGYAQMMSDGGGDARTLSLILSQVERMEQIISDFTRIATDQPAPKVKLPLGTHVRHAHALFVRRPDAAKIAVDVDLAADVEIVGNGRLLEQLTSNLLNNAREAMGGRGRIKVVVGHDAGAPALYVADWGPGIAPELRERLFEPYVTSRSRGSGLGLAVCRRIALEHGATIDLAPVSVIPDTPPPATVFRVRFPAPGGAVVARKRLLVVDDEDVICGIFRDLLGKECQVETVDTAEAALSRLREGVRFDLIVTDKNLPGLSGLELAQHVRQLDPDSKVMVMTGYPSLVTAQQALELGLVDYLLKPFDDIRQVREKIRAVLAEASLPAPTATGTRRIDVYEDAEASAQAIVDALRQLGLEPRVMKGPASADDPPPAGVVVSWDYGPAPGRAAMALARTAAAGAPFVVLVEHLSMETTLEALRSGCTACLPKLLSDPKALSRELSRALRLKP